FEAPALMAVPSPASRDAVFALLARESLRSLGEPAVDLPTGAPVTSGVNSSAPALDQLGGPTSLAPSTALTAASSPAVRSERSVLDLLDSTWADEGGQAAAMDDLFVGVPA